jgi:hypothetical protein
MNIYKFLVLPVLLLLIANPVFAGYFGGGPVPAHPGFRSGQYYSHPSENATSTLVVSADTHYAIPFYVPVTTTFTKIGLSVGTAVASTECRMGIYTNSSGEPGTRLVDSGVVSTASTGAKEVTISSTLPPGWYHLTVLCNGAPTLTASSIPNKMNYLGSGSVAGNLTVGYTKTETYGALPSTFGVVTNFSLSPPRVWLRL